MGNTALIKNIKSDTGGRYKTNSEFSNLLVSNSNPAPIVLFIIPFVDYSSKILCSLKIFPHQISNHEVNCSECMIMTKWLFSQCTLYVIQSVY